MKAIFIAASIATPLAGTKKFSSEMNEGIQRGAKVGVALFARFARAE
jgi:hypothetical protein